MKMNLKVECSLPTVGGVQPLSIFGNCFLCRMRRLIRKNILLYRHWSNRLEGQPCELREHHPAKTLRILILSLLVESLAWFDLAKAKPIAKSAPFQDRRCDCDGYRPDTLGCKGGKLLP